MHDQASLPASCPFCTGTHVDFIGRGLYYCPKCEIVFNASHTVIPYNDSYFLDEYRNQYGKTYQEDYNTIYQFAASRLNRIIPYLKKHPSRSRLLDVGAALGFFLKCALDTGFQHIEGIEISSFACEYARKQLDIPIHNSDLMTWTTTDTFDVISAWYVIEHFANTDMVFTKLNGLLNVNGVLAFSVPSIYGPSYRLNREQWIRTHPEDHRIDFSPAFLKRYLRKLGFKKVILFPAGIHPSRVLSSESLLYRFFAPCYTLYSRIFKYSDTLEVYAIK